MKFDATLLQSGKTATGIVVPPEVVEGLGGGKKPKVNVSLNGYHYRTSIGVMSGDFMIPVSADIRKAANVNAGDRIVVELSLDTAVREVSVPEDLVAALEASPIAKEKFVALSYSNQSRHVLSVEGAKTPETRQRRVSKVIEELSG